MFPDATIQAEITSARSKIPRFLFRYYNHSSGGSRSLNTEQTITPSAFSPTSKQIFASAAAFAANPDFDEDVIGTAILHLQNNQFARGTGTCFSSWSHSLPYIIAKAQAEAKLKPESNHHSWIVVLDTELCPDNLILHTQTMHWLLSSSIPTNPWEYLIYGIIKGEAYERVHWPWFQGLMGQHNLIEANQKLRRAATTDEAMQITLSVYQCAGKIGRKFNAPYQKVIMAHICGMIQWNEEGVHEAAKVLGFSDIPQAWTQDPKLVHPDRLICHSVPEVIRANEILRELVVLANPRGGDMLPSDHFQLRHEEAIIDMIMAWQHATKNREDRHRCALLWRYENLLEMSPKKGELELSKQHRWMVGRPMEGNTNREQGGSSFSSESDNNVEPRQMSGLRITNPDPESSSEG